MQKLLLAIVAAAMLAGCATTTGTVNPRDPWESFNRPYFNFNQDLDNHVLKPVVNVYTTVVPDFTRTWISNFFSNIGDVWVGVNNLLQGKPIEAASDVARVLVNSTFGILGIVDIATKMGLQHHNEDFGQTLGVWGFEPGPYLVLPVFGPRDVRDAFGLVADLYGNPIDYMHDVRWRNSLWAAGFLDARANLSSSLDLLEQASIDRYTFVRESYLQRRRNLVYDGNPPPLPPEPGDDTAPEPAKDKVSLAPAIQSGTEDTGAQIAPAPQPAESAGETGAQPQALRVVYPVEVPALPDLVADRSQDAANAEVATRDKP